MIKIDAVDYILFIMYAILYFKFIQYRAKKIDDPLLTKYLKYAYWFRVVSSFLFSMFVIYISGSDAIAAFFPEGKHIYHQIIAQPGKIDFLYTNWKDITDITLEDNYNGVYFTGANLIIIKFVVALNFLSFGNFITTSFLFSLLAFEGSWRLFIFFNRINPALIKYTAICFLFIPTYIFWTSGIVKETISIFCLGFIAVAFYQIIILQKAILIQVPVIIILSILLYNVKSYTIISYAPLLIYFLVKLRIAKSSKHQFIKYTLNAFFLVIVITAIIFFIDSENENFKEFQFDVVTETIESQQKQFKMQSEEATSSFALGVDFDPSFLGLVKAVPFAITASFYRPFIWEAKKVTTFISAIESLALLLVTFFVLFRCGPVFFFKKVFQNPLILFCFLFAIIFGFFCGISTLNFGSLVRYKLPCIPFYLYFLTLIYLDKKKVYLPSYN
jgi:hypothetical protein